MPGATAILGAGAWGTALAVILARNGHPAVLCARRGELLGRLVSARENETYLPGVEIPREVELTESWIDAVARASMVIMAIPSRYARAAMTQLASAIPPDAILLSATKGVEETSLATMTAMLAEVAPNARACAALSGPGFAAEVAREKPAALLAASSNDAAAREVQNLFASPALRVYRSSDVIGVELSGAAKNVIAIAAGISDGLALGSSARAAVITRGLAEIARLVEAAGGKRETVMGLAGLGDLVLTCTGDLSRNRSLGMKIGSDGGFALPASNQDSAPVAEGIVNARTVKMLAQRHGVEMPIVDAVYRALYEGTAPKAMVDELLSRAPKSEF
ncbi:MAG TPA: NAD(P)H-dependent glycerol-3-phosphate dehydrogenase [Candidatus Binataceae bacterium]|nr:NAD(P)H-dependent glycerol-3-phosphate dehydrogenase [Candidatus Binataceae bacterium]